MIYLNHLNINFLQYKIFKRILLRSAYKKLHHDTSWNVLDKRPCLALKKDIKT